MPYIFVSFIMKQDTLHTIPVRVSLSQNYFSIFQKYWELIQKISLISVPKFTLINIQLSVFSTHSAPRRCDSTFWILEKHYLLLFSGQNYTPKVKEFPLWLLAFSPTPVPTPGLSLWIYNFKCLTISTGWLLQFTLCFILPSNHGRMS